MDRKLIAVALCLIVIATIGAGVVAAKQDSNPRQAGNSSVHFYDVAPTDTHGSGKLMINLDEHTFIFNGKDFEPSAMIMLRARAADSDDIRVFATGKATPSGNLHIEGTWEAGAAPIEVVGGTYYSGTIVRAYSQTPCYNLTYTDWTGTHTVWLPPAEITTTSGVALPVTFPQPTAVAVVPMTKDTTKLDLVYQGITYTVPATHATCPGGCCWNPPYIFGDTNLCQFWPGRYDDYYGTIYIYNWDSLQNKYVKTPAAGVLVRIFLKQDDGSMQELSNDDIIVSGSLPIYTDSNGYFRVNTQATWHQNMNYGYATYHLSGYADVQEPIDHAPFCVED